MISLPVIDPCRDCGRCCSHVGTPPGFAAFFPRAGEVPEAWKAWPDFATLMAAPDAAREELRAYYAAVARGEVADRARDAVPCLWLDPQTKRCRHYASRPEVCREAVVPGDEWCRAFRAAGPDA